MDWTKHPPQPPGLSLLERGALIALEEIYLAHGGLPSSEKQILRACCAVSKPEIAAVASVLRQYFVLGDDGWGRTEWDALVVQALEIRAKRSAAANARWAQQPDSLSSKSNANASTSAGTNAIQPEVQRRGEEKEKTSSSLKQEEVKEGLQGQLGHFLCVTRWNEEDEARAGRLMERFGLEVMRGVAAEIEREAGRKPFLSRLEARLAEVGEVRPAAASHEGFASKDYMKGGGYVQEL